MRLTLAQLQEFVSQWRRMRLTDDDLLALEADILANPAAGKPMAGTGGLRKMRFAPPSWHTGKSGATRVVYVHFPTVETVVLMSIYAKQDKDNLTRSERNYLRKLIEALARNLTQRGPRR